MCVCMCCVGVEGKRRGVTAKTPINKGETTHMRRARAFFPVGAEYFDTDLDGKGGGKGPLSFAFYALPNV